MPQRFRQRGAAAHWGLIRYLNKAPPAPHPTPPPLQSGRSRLGSRLGRLSGYLFQQPLDPGAACLNRLNRV
jgi:hypothetical protein